MNPTLVSSIPHVHVDEPRRPLLVVTFTGVATDEEFQAYLEAQTRAVLRRQLSVTLVDAMNAGPLGPIHRKQQAEWQQKHAAILKEYSLGTAFAISSPIVRGFLTAILWIQPLPHPHHVAASRADAERWALGRLHAAGLSAPAAPISRRG